MSDTPLIDALAKALDDLDANTEYVLLECGDEIARFSTVAECKSELQNSWGEGELLEWVRKEVNENGKWSRWLEHQQFIIKRVDKGSPTIRSQKVELFQHKPWCPGPLLCNCYPVK